MGELIGLLATKAGLDKAVAEKIGSIKTDGIKIIGIMLDFRRHEGPNEPVQGFTDIQTIARELFRFGRDKIGTDRVSAICAGTPGLRQFA